MTDRLILKSAWFAGLTAILSLSTIAHAGNIWDGGGAGDLWSIGLNWNDDLTPSPGSELNLEFAGTTRLTSSNDFAAGSDFGGITFQSGAGAFILGGNAIKLNGDIVSSTAAATTINLDMALVGDRLFTPNSGSLTVAGVLSGTGSLEKTGGGMLTLTGTNSYTGGTTVTAGNLRVQAGGALGTGTITLNGGSFGGYNTTASADTMTISNAVEIRGDVALYTGTSVVRSRSTALGNVTTFGERSITYNNGGGFSGTNYGHLTMESLTLGGNTIINNAWSTYRANVRIKSLSDGGAGYSLTKRGAGTLEIAGTNTGYTGNIIIEAGHIRARSNAALGTGTVTLRSGSQLGAVYSVDNSGAALRIEDDGVSPYDVSLYTAGNSSNETGVFGPLTTVGTGTINVVQPIYGGINGETALVYATDRVGSVTVQDVSLGGNTTFNLTNVNGNAIGKLTINGSITDGGAGHAITKNGAGNLRVTGSLSSGNVKITGGVLSLGAGAIFSRNLGTGAGEFQFSSGANGGLGSSVSGGMTVTLGAGSITWGSTYFNPATLYLNESGDSSGIELTNAVDLGGMVRGITNNSTSGAATLSGALSNGGLQKNGSGLLILSSALNTFSGALNVYGGTLQVATLADSGTGSNGTGTIILGNANTTGTMRYAGSSEVALTAARTIQIGNGSGIGSGGIENAASDPAATISISNLTTAATGSDKILILGGTNTGANTISAITAASDAKKLSILKSGSGTWQFAGGTIELGGGDVTLQQGALNLGSTGALNNFGILLVGSNNPGAPLTMSGVVGGSYSLSGSTIRIGYRTGAVGTATDKCEGTLDVSAMTNFAVTVSNFDLGTYTGTADGSAGQGTVKLAKNNQITATNRVLMGSSYNDAAAGTMNRLTFGDGTNTVTTPTFTVGGAKSGGYVDIGTGGTLTFGNGANAADLLVSYDTNYTRESHFDMSNGTFIANLDDLFLGYKNANSSAPAGVVTKGILTLGPSANNAVTVAKLYVGKTGSSARSGTVTGELNMAGGTLNVAQDFQVGYQGNRAPTNGTVNLTGGTIIATNDLLVGYRATATSDGNNSAAINVSGGKLNVGGNVTLANWTTGTPGSVSGTLQLTGGETTIGGNITTIASQSLSVSTVTLDGGTLDLTGGTISVDTLNLRSGTLRGVAELFDGSGAITSLIKTTNGVLTLEGAMGYGGATSVNAGTLLINGTLSGTGNVTVANTSTLGGTGSIAGIVSVSGNLTGASNGTVGTLQIQNTLTLNATANSIFDLGGGTSDHIAGLGTLNYGGTLTLQAVGEVTVGVYDLFDFVMPWNEVSTFSNIFFPTLPNGLEWREYESGGYFDYATGQVEVIPEPGTSILLPLAAGWLLAIRRRRSR